MAGGGAVSTGEGSIGEGGGGAVSTGEGSIGEGGGDWWLSAVSSISELYITVIIASETSSSSEINAPVSIYTVYQVLNATLKDCDFPNE